MLDEIDRQILYHTVDTKVTLIDPKRNFDKETRPRPRHRLQTGEVNLLPFREESSEGHNKVVMKGRRLAEQRHEN